MNQYQSCDSELLFWTYGRRRSFENVDATGLLHAYINDGYRCLHIMTDFYERNYYEWIPIRISPPAGSHQMDQCDCFVGVQRLDADVLRAAGVRDIEPFGEV